MKDTIAEHEEAYGYRPQGDIYAAELMNVQSNSIPHYLVYYYLQTAQFEQAIRAAMAGATYSVSDPSVWNSSAHMLGQAFCENPYSPLLTDGETLIPMLMEYDAMLKHRNETARKPLDLDEYTNAFFEFVEALGQTGNDAEQIQGLLDNWRGDAVQEG